MASKTLEPTDPEARKFEELRLRNLGEKAPTARPAKPTTDKPAPRAKED